MTSVAKNPSPLSDAQRRRYARNIALAGFGEAGQAKLLQARVLVVGAGGLGAPAIAYLAAAGIGHLNIIDDDRVALSNLQRQILFETADIGQPKAFAAAERAGEMNPEIQITPHMTRVTEENVEKLVAGQDLVLEACDNFSTRFLLTAACHRLRKPLVSASVRAYGAQASVFASYLDNQPCYACFVDQATEEEAHGCQEAGVFGPLTGMAGSFQALQAIQWLAGFRSPLLGKLWRFDALTGESRIARILPDPNCSICSAQEKAA